MDGAALGARFSLATNRLQYCGPGDAEAALYAAIVDGERLDEARTKLRGFEALMPYLELLAAHHGRDPFDIEVVEAYWLGNALLDGFTKAEFATLFDGFVRRGMPRSIATRLSEHLPDDPLPHHAFHVSYVGVGTVTGHVETTLANIERCRPSWGEVRSVDASALRVRKPVAQLEGGRLEVGGSIEETVSYDPRVVPGVHVGDTVAMHWGWPALVLSSDQVAGLRSATARSLASANSAWPRLRALPEHG